MRARRLRATEGSCYCEDRDGTGRGFDTRAARCVCHFPAVPCAATAVGDCDDTRNEVSSGFDERCDLVDNDCDTRIDESGGPIGGVDCHRAIEELFYKSGAQQDHCYRPPTGPSCN